MGWPKCPRARPTPSGRYLIRLHDRQDIYEPCGLHRGLGNLGDPSFNVNPSDDDDDSPCCNESRQFVGFVRQELEDGVKNRSQNPRNCRSRIHDPLLTDIRIVQQPSNLDTAQFVVSGSSSHNKEILQ